MPIPNSGALALSAIQTEFGGSNPISLSEYYAGGANVPSGTTGINGAVPTSGTIAMSKFYGTSSILVSISNINISATRVGATATALYGLDAAGDIIRRINNTTTDIGDWVTPKSAASNYEVRATLVSGALSSGTTGSWLALTSNRNWFVEQTSFGTADAVIDLEIRKTGTTTVLSTARVTLQATYDL